MNKEEFSGFSSANSEMFFVLEYIYIIYIFIYFYLYSMSEIFLIPGVELTLVWGHNA